MPIYHVQTEADEEGFRKKSLRYIQADSADLAVRYLYACGIKPYYQYCVEDITHRTFLVYNGEDVKDLVAVKMPESGEHLTYWTVAKQADLAVAKQKAIEDKIKQSGLTDEEIESYLKGKGLVE